MVTKVAQSYTGSAITLHNIEGTANLLLAPHLSFWRIKLEGDCYGNKPKTATLVGVPTYARPFAIIGVMNLLSAKWSRAVLA